MKKRKDWIDTLRAFAMLNVMIWHFSVDVNGQWIYNVLTSSIMIPLFFVISGYVFNSCEGNNRIFYSKLARYLVLPWLSLAIIKGITIATIRGSLDYLFEFLINLFTGDNLWYFPCCILAEIIHFYIIKVSKDNVKKLVVFTICLIIVGFFISQYSIFKYLNISTALICQMFLLTGRVFKIYETKLFRMVKSIYIAPLTIYVSICVILLFNILPPPIGCDSNYIMDIHHNFFYSIPICFIMILCSNFSIWSILMRMDNMPGILTFIGKNTIVFYVFHYDTMLPLSIISSFIGIELENNWISVIIKLLWAVIICIVISLFFNKFFPLLVGKRKYTKNK